MLVAAIVAMLARRLRVPYSIGLVIAGIGLALLPISPSIELTKQLIFTAFLPPLIFEAAIFNDCNAAVAFSIVLALAGGERFGALGAAKSLLVMVFGAIGFGVCYSPARLTII